MQFDLAWLGKKDRDYYNESYSIKKIKVIEQHAPCRHINIARLLAQTMTTDLRIGLLILYTY